MFSKRPWKCPRCGREFARKGQWHSHASLSVDNMFDRKPKRLKEIFDQVLRELQNNGSVVRVDAVKSSINFAGKSHFGGVRVLKDSLNLVHTEQKNRESTYCEDSRPRTQHLCTHR